MRQTVDPVYEHILYMGRRFHPRARRARWFMDFSSLVDVVLLLALFVLIQSSFVLQPGIYVQLPPGGGFTSGTASGNLVVTVTRGGTVLFNDRLTTLDELQERLQTAADKHPGESLLIQVDSGVSHGTVHWICNLAEATGITEALIAEGLEPPATGGQL